jgi:threonine/homoserine/homoserine lactone efflux protein
VPEQMLLLSLVSFGIALISDSLWAAATSTARFWFAANPRRLAAVGGAGGLAMIGVGVRVAVTGRSS